ncbi:MAG: 1,4-dihydroxy-2-naphthoate octaprenyltransferase [Cyclobacteriaceae bacterium]|jgi:1,4-dihydroxy-2-naphthoate octaprenyltransferase
MSSVKHWIGAFRLRTLPLAFSSIFMGSFLAYYEGYFDPIILMLALLTTLFLQVLSNLANDYGDAQSGVDSDDREGPSRAVQSGVISALTMKNALVLFSVLSFLSGTFLILYVFNEQWKLILLFLLIGISAIWAAIKYTVGKSPYGYAGMGDFFVLIFFGFIGVGGTYFLFAQSFNALMILPSLSSGLLAVGVLNVNNIRDITSDAVAGKRSIPVRLGKFKASIYHIFLLTGAAAAGVGFYLMNDLQWSSWLFMFSLPLFLFNAVNVFRKSEAQIDPYLKHLALSTLAYTLLFGLGLALSVG